jgi:hypothetical protein
LPAVDHHAHAPAAGWPPDGLLDHPSFEIGRRGSRAGGAVSRSQALGAAGVLGVVLDEIPRLAVRNPLGSEEQSDGRVVQVPIAGPRGEFLECETAPSLLRKTGGEVLQLSQLSRLCPSSIALCRDIGPLLLLLSGVSVSGVPKRTALC